MSDLSTFRRKIKKNVKKQFTDVELVTDLRKKNKKEKTKINASESELCHVSMKDNKKKSLLMMNWCLTPEYEPESVFLQMVRVLVFGSMLVN